MILMTTLPTNAKKVFSGIIFDTYHYEQELYDGSTATFEMLKRPNTLSCLPVHEGKIMIAKDYQPHRPAVYTLIGGRQDPGESPQEGAAREFLEETGYIANDWSVYDTYSPSHKAEWNIYIFIAKQLEKIQPALIQAGEKVEPMFVTFDEFIDIVADEQFIVRDFALHVLRKKHNNTLSELKETLFRV